MYYALYTLLGWLLIIVALPFYALYCFLSGKGLSSLKQRFGYFEKKQLEQQLSTRIWLHAASVGEVQVAKALISELVRKQCKADFILSTVTEQGQIVAKKQIGKDALCIYAPIDLPWVVRRFFRVLQPSIYVCLETELWPNILKHAKQQGCGPLLLNGRMSEGSFNNYKIIAGFMAQVLNCFDTVATISNADRERYRSLGVQSHKIKVFGNAKYALNPLYSAKSSSTLSKTGTDYKNLNCSIDKFKKELMLDGNQPVLVAGSTHTGEEELLLTVYQALKKSIPQLVLVIAPRHLQRLDKIEALFSEKRVEYQKLLELRSTQRRADLILVDVMGELTRLYALATYVFCGGSLVDRGGHNIMEPAILGKAPIYGPHMKDFDDARSLLEPEKAGFTVRSYQELIDLILSFHNDKDEYILAAERARKVANTQHDAASNQIKIITNILNQ